MGLLDAESSVQSPREAMTFNESLGGRGRAGHTTVRSDVERSMMAYTERARLLMTTSVPEGLNNSSRFLQQKAFFSPVTWSQAVNTMPPQGYDLDYSFPHFKEREDLLGFGRREQPKKSAVKLFVGKEQDHPTKESETVYKTSPTKAMGRRKTKAQRSISVASIQTDKSRGKMSMATINDDRLSQLSVGTKDTSTASMATTYALALDRGSGNAAESEMSGSVLGAEPQGYAERPVKFQNGAYSMGRMFPPRNTHRKLPTLDNGRDSRRRNRHKSKSSPLYLLVGKSESLPNIDDVGKDGFSTKMKDGQPVYLTSRNDNIGEEELNPPDLHSDNTNTNNNDGVSTSEQIINSVASSAQDSLSDEARQIDARPKAHGENDPSTLEKVNTALDTAGVKSLSGEVKRKRGRKLTVVQPSVVNLIPGT